MNKIFQLSTKEYEPISIGSKYLFDQYDAIISFLKPKIENNFLKNIAFPKLIEKNDVLEWYSEFSGTFQTIDNFDEQKQIEIKQKYWEFKYAIDNIITSLPKTSKKTAINQWVETLDAAFNDNNNLILSNGQDCVILWGWNFNTSSSNYLQPQFLPNKKNISEPLSDDEATYSNSEENANGINVSNEEPFNKTDINILLNTIQTNEPISEVKIKDSIDNTNAASIVKLTFWERIKRFFRWISYRFWALMLLIILILLLFCLCKKCCHSKNPKHDNCEELDSINKRLEETKSRLKENCPTNNN